MNGGDYDMDWNNYTNNRSKAHHLNIQKGLCYMCKREFTPSSLNGKHWSSEDYPHAKLHNYRTGWMIRWKK